jgi:peptide deformylase
MKLILDPDPILKQIAVPWDFSVDINAEQVEAEMIEIMKTFHGRGLAGNQVGLLKRVFVIKLESTGETLAMFNPKVIGLSDTEQDSEEGCLSFPNLWLKIKRPNKIDVEYLDKTGKECKITLTGIDARCFLHELDHLDGITFTNKVSQMKLLLARKQQRKNNGRTKR